jgi:hypothetical protein
MVVFSLSHNIGTNIEEKKGGKREYFNAVQFHCFFITFALIFPFLEKSGLACNTDHNRALRRKEREEGREGRKREMRMLWPIKEFVQGARAPRGLTLLHRFLSDAESKRRTEGKGGWGRGGGENETRERRD